MKKRQKFSGFTHRELLAAEIGTLNLAAKQRVALLYPSEYRAAMSSLGYQTIYRLLNQEPNLAADRAVLPDLVERNQAGIAIAPKLTTLERNTPVGNYPALAFSVAYELEIAGVIDCLDLAGIPVLARDRGPEHPLVIAGGPLTFSNPSPLAPFFDLILVGEGEDLALELFRTIDLGRTTRQDAITQFAGRPGFYAPEVDGERVPPVVRAEARHLPARSQIITPHTELSSMFLTEAVRGCSRGCTYCVMRRSTNGGMRTVPPQVILDGIPDYATRVGLVGASVSDHPDLPKIVHSVVHSGRQIGISSLRADRLTDELTGLLARGGYRTLTVASDGASERLRRVIERSTRTEHLLNTVRLAKAHQLKIVKIYMMIGVPEEIDEDIDELIRFSLELAKIHPRIALGIAPFVAKRNTPLDGVAFAGISVVEDRLKRLRRGLKGCVQIRPVSARWAWVEYMLAQGNSATGLAALAAHRAGGRFADYKRAFARYDCKASGPVARVPSSREKIAEHQRKLVILSAQRKKPQIELSVLK